MSNFIKKSGRASTSHNLKRAIKDGHNSYLISTKLCSTGPKFTPKLRGASSKVILNNLHEYRLSNQRKVFSKAKQMDKLINEYDMNLESKARFQNKIKMCCVDLDQNTNQRNNTQKQDSDKNDKIKLRKFHPNKSDIISNEHSEFMDHINLNDNIQLDSEVYTLSDQNETTNNPTSNSFENTNYNLNKNLNCYLSHKENCDTSNNSKQAKNIDSQNAFGIGNSEGRKTKLDRIFITPIEYISNELENDLTKNGADKIIKRQMIRKVRPEFCEFFDHVTTAPYSLRNMKKKNNNSSINRSNTYKSNGSHSIDDYQMLSFENSKGPVKRPETASCILKEKGNQKQKALNISEDNIELRHNKSENVTKMRK